MDSLTEAQKEYLKLIDTFSTKELLKMVIQLAERGKDAVKDWEYVMLKITLAYRIDALEEKQTWNKKIIDEMMDTVRKI